MIKFSLIRLLLIPCLLPTPHNRFGTGVQSLVGESSPVIYRMGQDLHMNLCRCVCPCHSLGEEFWSQHFTSRHSTYLLRIWSDKHCNCNLWGKTMNNFQNGSMLKKIIYLLSPHQRRQSWPGSDMLCQWRRFLLNDPCSHKDNTSLDSDSIKCGRLWQGSPWNKGGGKNLFQQYILVLECFNTLTRTQL